ncbi:hypothetical protein M6I34_08710 [Burkholderiaceae bacterium FT117]|uniref:hypothetical protein n=1 Tax=Zeimonas sediminis TaxID=2944268 RepID=UPI002342FEDF|nr:hypothetical protein [Zeimonas sediminis]MCM5570588.1 hypothetical protein [Zeimonas sediminis]
MIKIARILVPAALALGAAGVSAQTVETDYPVVTGTVGAAVTAPAQAASAPSSDATPFLIQSNAEGVRVNSAYEQASMLSREEVAADAIVRVPSPGHSA